jgi:hypothetical protein
MILATAIYFARYQWYKNIVDVMEAQSTGLQHTHGCDGLCPVHPSYVCLIIQAGKETCCCTKIEGTEDL